MTADSTPLQPPAAERDSLIEDSGNLQKLAQLNDRLDFTVRVIHSNRHSLSKEIKKPLEQMREASSRVTHVLEEIGKIGPYKVSPEMRLCIAEWIVFLEQALSHSESFTELADIMMSVRVMIVEDDEGNRDVIDLIFRKLPHITFESGESALKQLENIPEGGVVVTDLDLGKRRMNGEELAREIDRRRGDLSLVLLSTQTGSSLFAAKFDKQNENSVLPQVLAKVEELLGMPE